MLKLYAIGVPSTKLWKKYISNIEKKYKSSVEKFFFRNKKYGWKLFGQKIIFKNGKEIYQPLFINPFFKMFNSNLCLRPSCYFCKAKGEYNKSDISLGDFWNIENVLPELDDDRGTSMIILNTEKGKNFFYDNCYNLEINDKNLNYEIACKCNSAIIKSMNISEKRDDFFYDLDNISFDKLTNKYVPNSAKDRIKQFLTQVKLFGFIKKIKNGK